ncbi:hypothetical protein JCM12296A_20720 [Desulfosarcina cetonica]|uniref:hypothetical protein n=1 Tax=Desulfosarcina cetonica TaxID=90730 RepID=UPI0012ED8E6C|nr:hypothetical protein [Desulfosarcina cetonica]
MHRQCRRIRGPTGVLGPIGHRQAMINGRHKHPCRLSGERERGRHCRAGTPQDQQKEDTYRIPCRCNAVPEAGPATGVWAPAAAIAGYTCHAR